MAPNYDPTAFGGLGGDLTTGDPYLTATCSTEPTNDGFHNFAGFPDHHPNRADDD